MHQTSRTSEILCLKIIENLVPSCHMKACNWTLNYSFQRIISFSWKFCGRSETISRWKYENHLKLLLDGEVGNVRGYIWIWNKKFICNSLGVEQNQVVKQK